MFWKNSHLYLGGRWVKKVLTNIFSKISAKKINIFYDKAFKFRIYSNQKQLTLIYKTFCYVKFVYNHFLNQKIELYKNDERLII